ncbi:hypothetical protein [Mangrovibacterium lignilyticum]|uniref:hypothetical protein n=1 Tax=Mangrovibacterium lignilyticum TaxID=2668052 RepID=UPI0013D616D1|nr:hypothetical protein [Mangrovibacterium lignilyticum]
MKKTVLFSVAAVTIGLMVPQFVGASPLAKANTNMEIMAQEVSFEEIETSALPEAVSTALSADYSGYTLDKAFKGSDGSFKVSVSSGEMKYDLFYTAAGELTKVEAPTAE